ncbi:MAG: polyphenol oxidase family protein [Pseudobdellovibrio sp.]
MINWTETEYGFSTVLESKYLIFFGKKNTTIEHLKNQFSKFSFYQIQQTHSNICLNADLTKEVEVGDAHYTQQTNKALIIKTADCMPILAYDKISQNVLAIHAGWRGVENQVISHALIKSKFQQPAVFIGPHILQKSFEVKFDAFTLLKQRVDSYNLPINYNSTFEHVKLNSYKISLLDIVNLEFNSRLKDNYSLEALMIDTVTSNDFHSFRREKENTGRNLSFIVRIGS